MVVIALVLSLIFFSLGFIVTKGNAKYILSGYNTMPETERSKVDIEGLVRFFNRFHVVLGVSLFAGVLLISRFNNNWASAFMIMYPLIAYLYMIVKSDQFYKNTSRKKWATYFGGGILVIVIAVVGYTQLFSYKSSDILLKAETLEFEGMYGTEVSKQDIFDMKLVNELPPISYKSNGFAAGDHAKGSFKLKDGRTVRLFVDKKGKSFLWLRTRNGEVYYNSEDIDMSELYKKIMNWRGL